MAQRCLDPALHNCVYWAVKNAHLTRVPIEPTWHYDVWCIVQRRCYRTCVFCWNCYWRQLFFNSSRHGSTITQSQILRTVLPARWSTSTLYADSKRVSSSSLSAALVWKAGQQGMATTFTCHLTRMDFFFFGCSQEQSLWEKTPHSEWIERLHFSCIRWNWWGSEFVYCCVGVFLTDCCKVESGHFVHLRDYIYNLRCLICKYNLCKQISNKC